MVLCTMSVNLHIRRRYKVGSNYVRPNHEEARSAFLLWRYNGKPRFGPIFDLLQRTRANFKSTLRKCISGNDNRTADSLATKFLNKDFKRFVVILEKIMSRTLQYLVL